MAGARSPASGLLRTKGPNSGSPVMTGRRNRGARDILIAVADGLKGFPDASNASVGQSVHWTARRPASRPETMVQTCFAHRVRHSLNFRAWKDRKAVAARLREVDSAGTAEAARDALEAFDAESGRQYPSIARAWRRAWDEVTPFFAFSPEIPARRSQPGDPP